MNTSTRDFEFDVFISYTRSDKRTVGQLIKRLRKDNLRVWVDEEQMGVGDPLDVVLEQAISKARHCILCLSSSYLQSPWCTFEAQIANSFDPDNRNRRLLVAKVDQVDIPKRYERYLWADLTGRGSVWEAEYQKLLRTLKRGAVAYLDESASDGIKENSVRKPAGPHVLRGAIVALSPVLTGIVVVVAFPDWIFDPFGLLAAIIAVSIVLLVALLVAYVPLSLPAKVIWIAVTLIGVAMMLQWVGVRIAKRGTAYIIVDASENMTGVFSGLPAALKTATREIPENFDVGLMVFGGGLTGSTGCDDIITLAKPVPKKEGMREIESKIETLAGQVPQGPGCLTKAITRALRQDLAGRQAIQQIVVLTSGADSRCGVLDRAVVDQAATDAGTGFVLTIVAVGSQSERQKLLLGSLADRGQFREVAAIEQIPTVLPGILIPPRGIYGAPYSGPYNTPYGSIFPTPTASAENKSPWMLTPVATSDASLGSSRRPKTSESAWFPILIATALFLVSAVVGVLGWVVSHNLPARSKTRRKDDDSAADKLDMSVESAEVHHENTPVTGGSDSNAAAAVKREHSIPFIDIQRRLVDLLLKIPAMETLSGRTSLLDGLPNPGLIRDENIARLDLNRMIGGLAKMGRLAQHGGAPPLIVFVDNALAYVPAGGEIAQELNEIKRLLAQIEEMGAGMEDA